MFQQIPNIQHIKWLILCLITLHACNTDTTTETSETTIKTTQTTTKTTETTKTTKTKIPKEVTFAEHIAPIIHQNCTPCHRPNEAGPFYLRTYEEVAKHARMIQYVTSIGFMPPWPADPNYRSFAGERSLTEHEKQLIKAWVRGGWKEGDQSKTPPIPEYPEGSQLGKPDMVIKMPEKYKITGNSEDKFLTMKIPYELPKDTFVKIIEFVPNNRKLVHHVNGHLLAFDSDKKEKINEGQWVVDAYKHGSRKDLYQELGILHDDGSYPEVIPLVSNYLPGVVAQEYPQGIGGWQMKQKGAIVMNDIHYGPTPIDDFDQSYFNVFFAKEPPKRPTLELQLGTLGISDIVPPLVVPADSVKTFRTKAKVLGDISLLTVNPHMHLLGKDFLAFAVTPQNDTIPLVKIPEWDFRWQYFYTFKNMLKLPKGSIIYVEATFDNTAENPNNPYSPPRVVTERDGSMRTTDEMLQLIITFVPYEAGDELISLE